MNLFCFVGNLTRDPETAVTQSGDAQTKFTIALNRQYKDASGNQDADYVRITCYRKTAENAAKYLAKGRRVGVNGHVKTGSYEKDGKRIYTTDFIGDNVEFLSSAHGDGAQTAPEPGPAPMPQQTAPMDAMAGYTAVSDDGLPF